MTAITRDMVISQIVQVHPETRFVFASHGMGCISCMAGIDETVADGARMHGIDVDALLSDLNEVLCPQDPP